MTVYRPYSRSRRHRRPLADLAGNGETIRARFMRQNSFEFRPQFKLTVLGNYAPAVTNLDDAIRRRFLIVPFTRKPANPDPTLEEQLRREWPGLPPRRDRSV